MTGSISSSAAPNLRCCVALRLLAEARGKKSAPKHQFTIHAEFDFIYGACLCGWCFVEGSVPGAVPNTVSERMGFYIFPIEILKLDLDHLDGYSRIPAAVRGID